MILRRGAQSCFPTCCGGARPREKEQLLSSCSLQSAVHCRTERRVSVGSQACARPPIPTLAPTHAHDHLLQTQCESPLNISHSRPPSKFHIQVTFGHGLRGILISFYPSPPKLYNPAMIPSQLDTGPGSSDLLTWLQPHEPSAMSRWSELEERCRCVALPTLPAPKR